MEYLTLTFYVASVAFYILHLHFGNPKVLRGGFIVFAVGMLFHIISFMLMAIKGYWFPIYHMKGALSFFSAVLGGVFIGSQLRGLIPAFGYLTTPAVAFFYALSIVSPAKETVPPVLKSILFPLHVSFAFLGYTFFFISFLTGFFYLFQERSLKTRLLPSFFSRIPPLVELDSMNYRAVQVGFTFLTFAMLTGSIWSEREFGRLWNWDPKEVLTLMTWVLYALYLHLRLISGWRGRRIAILSILGFIAVLLTFLGAKLIPGKYHVFI